MEYRLTTGIVTPGGAFQGTSVSTAGGQVVIDDPQPAAQTNISNAAAFPFAKAKSIFMKALSDTVIKTNSSSDPDDTITLAAGIPVSWDQASPWDCPFTADVEEIYVSNAALGHLQFYVLYDPT